MKGSIHCAVGPKGSGKSYWAKKWAKKHKRRLLLFDATGEYRATGKEGIPGLVKFKGLREYFTYLRGGGKAQRCAIQASWRTFDAFCRFAFDLGNCDVIIEEVSTYASEAGKSRAFRDLCDRSRHQNVRTLCIVSRPAFLPSFFRSQCDEWVVFKTREPTDLDFWRKRGGAEAVDRISKLNTYEHFRIL